MSYGNHPNTEEDDEIHNEGDDTADAFAAVGLILLFVILATTFVATQ